MLFIICGNGFAYAQTFNETPIPAFTLHKKNENPSNLQTTRNKEYFVRNQPCFQ